MATQKKSYRKYRYIALALAATVLAMAILELTNTTHLFHTEKVPPSTAKTTSTSPTAQPTFNAGTDTKTPATTSGNNGGIIDTSGAGVASANNPNPTTSSSGAISVLSPASGQKIRSGDLVAGTAKITNVQYRLVDNEIGKIAEGSLGVAGGNFSGTLQFTSHGSSGTFVMFSTDPVTGAEINRVSIDVTF